MSKPNQVKTRKKTTNKYLHYLYLGASLTLYSLLFYSISLAQSFSWKDANGNLVYGSRPPKNAKQVSKLKTRTLSRYSSDKVLSRVQSQKSKLTTNAAKDTKDYTAAKTTETKASFIAASLSASSASVKFDASKRLSACKAEVKNESQKAAANVSVAFEFKDGTLVPAVGPTEIAAEGTANYSIPKDLLPLPLENSETAGEEVPEVIVHGLLSE